MLRQLGFVARHATKNERRRAASLYTGATSRSSLIAPTVTRSSILEASQHRHLSTVQDNELPSTSPQLDSEPLHDQLLEAQPGNTLTDLLGTSNEGLKGRDVLLQSLANTIAGNVDSIICVIDGKQDETKIDEPLQRAPKKNELLQQWIIKLRIEKQRYQRRNPPARKPRSQMSIDDLWEEALNSVNIPFRSRIESGQVDTVSPIFGFQIDDETGSIIESDSIFNEVGEVKDSGELPMHERGEEMDSQITLDMEAAGGHDQTNKLHIDVIHKALALLSATRADEWASFDSRFRNIDHKASEEGMLDTSKDINPRESRDIQELLGDIKSERYVLNTLESNLLLARMVTSIDTPTDAIFGEALQIYQDMKLLSLRGREESAPDATTYRILILALSRRLMGLGEAVGLCQDMLESQMEWTPEAFLDAVQACSACNDLATASRMMKSVFSGDLGTFRPPVGSYILMLEMMKHQDLKERALNLFRRVETSNLLTWEDENRLLLNLCRWPTRTRRGDFIDSVPLLLKILDILSMKLVEGEKAKLQIWITVVDQLSRSAHSDSTLWKHVNAAMRTMFKAYPAMYPGMKLLRIGLQASESTADADLAADIIRKEVTNHTRPVRSDRTTLESVVVGLTEAGDGLGEDKAQCIPERSPVPHQVFRKSLETCLRCNDTRSASAILESFNQISGTYPIGAQAELNAMVLLCYAKAGHAESAKHLLFDMMKSGMHPSEDMFGAVLHSFADSGRPEEAHELFRSMDSEEDGFEVKPGISCYNAILLTHVKAHSWDEVISVCETMQEKEITANPQTIQGLALAYYRKEGRVGVMSFLEKLSVSKATVDETTFKLAVRLLLPEIDATRGVDDIRKQIREIGESDPQLRDTAISLIRSVRVAHIEQNRPGGEKHPVVRAQSRQDEAWKSVLSHLLKFLRSSDRV